MKQEYKSLKKNKQSRAQRNDHDDVVVMDMEKTSVTQTEMPTVAAGQSDPQQSRSSSGKTRGSIGRLMAALNESKLIAPPNSFVTLHDHD